MKKYCPICERKFRTKIITGKETYMVFGEPIEVESRVLRCSNCGTDLLCEELEEVTLKNVYNEYCRRHNISIDEFWKLKTQRFNGGHIYSIDSDIPEDD